MLKKKGEIDGLIILVFTTETARRDPIRQAPLSPKNIWALGKLNLRKINIAKIIKNIKYKISLFPLIKFIANRMLKIIRV